MNPHRARAYLMLLFVAFFWGIAGPIIKFTLGDLPTLPFLTYRFFLSTVAVLAILPFSHFKIPKSKGVFLLTLLYGFTTSTVALGLLFWGLEKTTALDMALITSTAPLLIAVAGAHWLKEHITKREKIGMSIAFLGTSITILEPLLENGFKSGQVSGNFLMLLYLLVNTVSAVLAKILLRKGVSAFTLTGVSFTGGFLTILPLSITFYGLSPMLIKIQDMTLPYHLGVIYMAIISGNLAYFLANKAQKTIEIGEAALFTYLNPLFALPLAIFWLKEKISLPFIFGAVFISIGVIIAEYKKPRKSTP